MIFMITKYCALIFFLPLCLYFVLPAYVEELALGIGFVPTFCIEVVFFVEFLSGDSGNPSRSEGGDVELGGRTSKIFFCASLIKTLFFHKLELFIAKSTLYDLVL